VNRGPLAEVDFWRERATSLCALYECMQTPSVKRMLEMFARTESSMEILRRDVARLYDEANDIARFLMTVERHLKNLTYGVSFRVVMDTIPPMMNALRIVWIVSRHYNTDEKVE
jgi:dynein heavy chain